MEHAHDHGIRMQLAKSDTEATALDKQKKAELVVRA